MLGNLLFVPFIFIVFLANLADKRRLAAESDNTVAGLTYLFHIFIFGCMAAVGILLQGFGLLINSNSGLADSILPSLLETGDSSLESLWNGEVLSNLGAGLWGPALVAMLLLLPPARRHVARVIPIDPRSTVHGVALSFVMLIVINLTTTLAIGLETLADLSDDTDRTNSAALLATLWTQQLTMAIWALVGVGWLTRRMWSQVLERLGLVVPRPREVGIGVGIGLLSICLILLLEAGAAALGFGPDENVERLTEVLLGPLLTSIPGILTLGLAAGIGEETLYRGALQPRFGLLVTSFLFAITHSNYGISLSTLLVFMIGLVFGLVRIRFNTTTSVIAHASYNSTLGLIALLAQQIASS